MGGGIFSVLLLFAKGEVSLEHHREGPLVEWLSLPLLIGIKILPPLRHMKKKKYCVCGGGLAYLPLKFFRCLTLSFENILFFKCL